MPELPEVTTITNQLKREIIGSTIGDVRSVGGYKTQPEFPEFKKRSLGLKVSSVRRIAKNIVIEVVSAKGVSTNMYIVIHLAMTGRLLLRSLGYKPDPWTRLVFKLEAGSGKPVTGVELRFCDSRMFGFVRLASQEELEQYANKYGPDALDEKLTPKVFLEQLKKKRTEVKRALLSQDLIAGAGNIYVNDSLWMARIHPMTRTTDLKSNDAVNLLGALQEILQESIEHRGSTLGDKMYIDVYGEEGTHQNHFRVFGKNGKPCIR